jgi:hypothetical protein
MKKPFTLYWVETPSAEENCFIAARSRRAAASYEEDGTGFDRGDCQATAVRNLESDWVANYRESKSPEDLTAPFYVQFEDLHDLGIEWRIVEGDEVFQYHDHQFVKQGDLNYLASLGDEPEVMVIRSVTDLLGLIKKNGVNDWIFRGHSSCFWHLKAGAHRSATTDRDDLESLISRERRLLNEFKRRARMFIQTPPSSDWEWLVLAQHFGLPTRMLDWTENPLVALYFSLRDRQEISNDGMLYAYRHGEEGIDIESTADPFAIQQIELIRPPHLDQRVIAQQSVFTVEPPLIGKGGRDKSHLKYWYVSVKHKGKIREELATLGVTESTLFPGLQSVAAEIKEKLAPNALPTIQRTKPRGTTRNPSTD